MRITGPGQFAPPSALRPSRAVSPGFRPGSAAEARSAGGAARTSALTTLAFVDEVGERRREGSRRGRRVLDLLEALRLARLGDGSAAGALAALAQEVVGLPATEDPRLAAVLDQVRIRAEVELAKAEAARLSTGR